MKRDLSLVRWLTFAALLAVAGVFLLPGLQRGDALILPMLALIIVAALFFTWALELWLSLILQRTTPSSTGAVGAPENVQEFVELNRKLLQATHPQEVLEVIMTAACESVSAAGCSFVPYDEWGQSLPALAHGAVSAAERLTAPDTRQACKTCKALGAARNCVLLRDTEHVSGMVRCLTLKDNERELGVFNFYFKSKRVELSDAERVRLDQLLSLARAALQALSARAHVFTTLPDTLSQRATSTALLEGLLSNLQKTLDVETALFWIPGGIIGGSRHASFVSARLQDEHDPATALSASRFVEDVWASLQQMRQPILRTDVSLRAGETWPNVAAFPLVWNNDAPLGVLLVGARHPFADGQLALLKTLASEATLIVLKARLLVDVEYQAVLAERARLAREIHDGLAQTLAFLKMQADQMQMYLAQGKPDRLSDMLKASSRTLNDAYLDARQAIDDLRRIPDLGLDEMLRHMAIEFTTATNLPVNTVGIAALKDLSLNARAQLLRIVQEALANVRKHAQAQSVTLVARMAQGELILEVRDDGLGFTPEMVADPTQYGLRGMRERAEMIGAEFQVISQPGAGTTVRLQIPMGIGEAP